MLCLGWIDRSKHEPKPRRALKTLFMDQQRDAAISSQESEREMRRIEFFLGLLAPKIDGVVSWSVSWIIHDTFWLLANYWTQSDSLAVRWMRSPADMSRSSGIFFGILITFQLQSISLVLSHSFNDSFWVRLGTWQVSSDGWWARVRCVGDVRRCWSEAAGEEELTLISHFSLLWCIHHISSDFFISSLTLLRNVEMFFAFASLALLFTFLCVFDFSGALWPSTTTQEHSTLERHQRISARSEKVQRAVLSGKLNIFFSTTHWQHRHDPQACQWCSA